MSAADVLNDLMALPPKERRAIALRALASLEGSSELTHEDRWFVEVERRWHAIETGAEDTVAHEEALDFVFAPLRKKAV